MSGGPKEEYLAAVVRDQRFDLKPNASCRTKQKPPLKLKPDEAHFTTHLSLTADPKLLLKEMEYLIRRGDLSDSATRNRVKAINSVMSGDEVKAWKPYALMTEYYLKTGNPRQYTESKFLLQWHVDQGHYDKGGERHLVLAEIKRLESEFNNRGRVRGNIEIALAFSEKNQKGEKSLTPLLAAGGCAVVGGAVGVVVGAGGGPAAPATVPAGVIEGASIGAGLCGAGAEAADRYKNYKENSTAIEQHRENGVTPWSAAEVFTNGAMSASSAIGAFQGVRNLFAALRGLGNARKFAFIGYASGYGGRPNVEIGELVAGSQGGPDKLRELGGLNALGKRVIDLGNATCCDFKSPVHLNNYEKLGNNAEEVLRASYALKDKVLGALKRGLRPVVVGGDHTQSIGTDAALAEHYGKSIGHIHIDTHADYNTIASSGTRNMHGMPLSFLTGADKELSGFRNIQSVFPAVKRENMVLISLRDIDPEEMDLLKANNITFFTAQDVSRLGLNEVFKRAKSIASNNTPGYNVSFDIDVVEGAFVPGTGTSVSFNPGEFATGMAPHNARYAVASLLQDGRALAVEVTELNPNLDRQNKTADFALSILKTVGKNWK